MASNANTDSITPADQSAVAEAVRAAHDARQSVTPLGGQTAIDYGNPVPPNTQQLDLTGLNRIVDYTPRDMTILVEAGVRMADLAAALAAEGQQLPIDVPRAAAATIGGTVATNWSGPRRLGYGTLRDYVIGIHAVDGRGIAFKGGGRVVKNVAGYDFCKLLTGSLGTLAVITQLAFKLKPLPEQTATITAACTTPEIADQILTRLANLAALPVAVDLLAGPAWQPTTSLPTPHSELPTLISLRVEGTETEVAWLAEHIQYELWAAGGADVERLAPPQAETLWTQQVEFADRGPRADDDNSPLVLKIAVPPSAVLPMLAHLRAADPACSIQAHAPSGIIFARFAKFAPADVSATLIGKLRPDAAQLGGTIVVVRSKLDGLTPHITWGGRTEATVLMERIKHQFDPQNILNPGRFVY